LTHLLPAVNCRTMTASMRVTPIVVAPQSSSPAMIMVDLPVAFANAALYGIGAYTAAILLYHYKMPLLRGGGRP
jgi:hypothetical protein